ncbi:MAG: hypothetical protein GY848_05485 [Methyloversatilis sp.]|nr:hypothetical protein [Methyloversatilis sp.]
MAGEILVVYGTSKTLEANGASIANNNKGIADDATYSVASDGGGYPDAEFVASFAFGTAPTENTTLVLLAQPLDVDGTPDTDAPEDGAATFKAVPIGSFVVNNSTTTQYARLVAYDLPPLANYYLWNNATGQAVSAGWTLKVRPRTYKPAA